MTPARRGASAAVARTLNGDGAVASAARVQLAVCPLCRSELSLDIGSLVFRHEGRLVERSGVTIERCTNTECPNAVPHAPIASEPMIPEPPPKRRKKKP